MLNSFLQVIFLLVFCFELNNLLFFFFFKFLALIIQLGFGEEFQCPRNEQSQQLNGIFPDPNNRQNYFHCINGVAFLKNCPLNSFFNLEVSNEKHQLCNKQTYNKDQFIWSEWSEFGDCYPNCGNGIRARFRRCHPPPSMIGEETCVGQSVEIKECTLGDCPVSHQAFFVSNRRRGMTALQFRHTFNKVYLNTANIYNVTSSSVKVKQPGFYWLNFVLTNDMYQGKEMGANSSSEFRRSHYKGAEVTDELNSIIFLKDEDELYRSTRSRFYNASGSEDGAETSWFGYKINSPYVYYAQRSNDSDLSDSILSFDTVKISKGITGSSKIKVPKDGYYFISLSFYQTRTCFVGMRVNEKRVKEMWMNMTGLPMVIVAYDMKSKSIIMKLNSSDEIDFVVEKGVIHSSRGKQITLSAYYLNETSEILTAVLNTNFNSSGEFKKLEFDYILHNVGNSWDSSLNNFKCKQSGLYKISLSLGPAYRKLVVGEILVNGQVKGRMNCPGFRRKNKFTTRSNLLKLNPDDIISVRVNGTLDGAITNSILNIIYISS